MARRSSSAPLHFRKTLINGVPALVPTDDAATDWLRKRKINDAVAMSADQVRNAERSALYWVLCGLVAENSEEIASKQAASAVIQILTGCVHIASYMDGGKQRFIQYPKSLAFANMGEDEFEIFFNLALEAISTVLLPGVDIEELRKEAYLRSGGMESSTRKRA